MAMLTDVLTKICWIGLGGFLGANARYWLGGWIAQRYGTLFPWGTFVVNISGSFILGLFVAVISERVIVPPYLRLLVAIGFVGAYTTFSTFEYETLALAERGSLFIALMNIVASVIAGFIAVWIGMKLGRAM